MDRYYKFKKSDFLYIGVITLSVLTLFYYGHEIMAAILVVLSVMVLLYLNSLYIYKRKKWEKFIEKTAKKFSSSVVRAAEEADMPMVLVRHDGEIIWFNKSAVGTFGIEVLGAAEIEDLIRMKPADLFQDKTRSFIDTKIDTKSYHVSNVFIDSEEGEFQEDLVLMTFMDTTSIREAEDEKTAVMLMEIDNYNDLMKSIDNEKKPFLMAELENMIYGYAQSLSALVKRYDTSKYLLVVPNKYIEEEAKRKFTILDRIKEIDQGNTLETTLSIGVGINGSSPGENSTLANAAKELALGRGGDQVVIKSKDTLQFFGGNSKEIEKKTRVRSRVVAHALRDLILESGKVFIMGHKNPDMDCLGASIGINVIARELKKEVYILNEEPFSNILPLLVKFNTQEKYLETFITPDAAEKLVKKNDLLIIVDVHSQNYILSAEMVKRFDKFVIIDHHRRAPDQVMGSTLSYIENYASSTSELVTELIQYIFEKPNLSSLEAEALFAGIRVDTKSFNFKTGVRTFEAATFLKRLGASSQDIRELFAGDLESYVKRSQIIQNAVIEDNIAISTVEEADIDLLLAAQAADEMVTFKNISAAFVLTKVENDIVINGRSMGIFNVQVILEKLGGGGHMTMAGARLTDTSMEDALARLKEAIHTDKKEEDKL